MTLAAVFFKQPLLIAAFCIFCLMLAGVAIGIKKRIFIASYWILAIFPGILVLAVINAVGLGGYAFDDFSHWVPNALYVFQNNDVPSKEVPSLHSIYPGYPYALSYLIYLASLLVGGFLVQGGAMINFLLLFVFSIMLVETKEENEALYIRTHSIDKNILRVASLALLLTVFFNSSIATFGLTNQGDTGTMVLCGALGIMFWRVTEILRLNNNGETRKLSLSLALTAIAFVLIKEANFVLLLFLVFAFLFLSWRSCFLIPALTRLPLILLPALGLRVLWQFYANSEIGGGGVGILPLHAWKFDLFEPLLEGIWQEIKWKYPVFVLMFGTIGCGIFSIFRSPGKWRSFAILASIVQIGYVVFVFAAFLGSDFTEYTIREAASFHRYMLHAAFLGVPTFWFMAVAFMSYMKEKKLVPVFLSSPFLRGASTFCIVLIIPIIAFVKTDWIVVRPAPSLCTMRKLAYETAQALPNNSKLGAIFLPNDGLAAFVVNLGLALGEVQTGRSMNMVWHSDSFHSYVQPTESDVKKRFFEYPETNALVYSPDAKEIVVGLGLKDIFGSGFLIREKNEWISRPLRLPKKRYYNNTEEF
ncbi:MAG: hypothetical protein WC464_02780 [Bdellovibrionales bacterium]